MPQGWLMMGVVPGPCFADPAIRGNTWAAWVRGANGEIAKGEGDSAQQAVADLANQLDKPRAVPNGFAAPLEC